MASRRFFDAAALAARNTAIHATTQPHFAASPGAAIALARVIEGWAIRFGMRLRSVDTLRLSETFIEFRVQGSDRICRVGEPVAEELSKGGPRIMQGLSLMKRQVKPKDIWTSKKRDFSTGPGPTGPTDPNQNPVTVSFLEELWVKNKEIVVKTWLKMDRSERTVATQYALTGLLGIGCAIGAGVVKLHTWAVNAKVAQQAKNNFEKDKHNATAVRNEIKKLKKSLSAVTQDLKILQAEVFALKAYAVLGLHGVGPRAYPNLNGPMLGHVLALRRKGSDALKIDATKFSNIYNGYGLLKEDKEVKKSDQM